MIDSPHPILLLGAGGLGREVAALVQALARTGEGWSLEGFADDGRPAGTHVGGLPVLGGIDALIADIAARGGDGPVAVALCVGDNPTRLGLRDRLRNALGDAVVFPTLRHPDSTLDPQWVRMGEGNLIGAGVRMTADVQVGDLNIINMNAVLAHDVVVGDGCQINPGALLNGGVSIGDGAIIGAGAVILPRVTVGSGATVAIGAVVGADVGPGDVVAGNPGRIVRRGTPREAGA